MKLAPVIVRYDAGLHCRSMVRERRVRRAALMLGLLLASACTAPTPPAPATAPSAIPAPTGTVTLAATQTTLPSVTPIGAPSVTPTGAPSVTPTGAPAGTPVATERVPTGNVLSITQVVGLSFIDPQHGWLLAASCQENFCPAT